MDIRDEQKKYEAKRKQIIVGVFAALSLESKACAAHSRHLSHAEQALKRFDTPGASNLVALTSANATSSLVRSCLCGLQKLAFAMTST